MAQSILRTVQSAVAEVLRAAGFPPGGLLLVAVSGGQDSSCLLHALSRVAPELGARIAAAHVNHGLRGPAAAADEEAARALATTLGVPFSSATVGVESYARAHRLGLEEAARYARYQVLLEEATRQGAWALATGHTTDDLAETLLINMIRGTGLPGLASIRPVQHFDPSTLGPPIPEYRQWAGALPPRVQRGGQRVVRPLLGVTREQTALYCRAADIVPRIDASNLDPRFLRNRIRHHLLPLLRTYNPSIVAALARIARIAADEDAELEALVDQAWGDVVQQQNGQLSMVWEPWSRCSPAIQRRLLRRARSVLAGHPGGAFEPLEAARQLLAERRSGRRLDLGDGVQLVTARDGFRLRRRHSSREEED